MSGKNNTNMNFAMSANYSWNNKQHESHLEDTVYTNEEDMAEYGWYDKINNFLPENDDTPLEIIQEMVKEDAFCKSKIAVLVKIIGRKNRDSLEQEEALAKERITNESIELYSDAQTEEIGRLEKEVDQQKKDYDEIRKSMEDVKRQLAAKESFLQSVESINKRLSEDLSEKMNTLDSTGKDKKSLTKLANDQKKEISDLYGAVDHLKKEVATKGHLVEKYEWERRQWIKQLAEQRGPLFQKNEELRARLKVLESELSSTIQSVQDSGMELYSSLKTLHSARSPTPGEEPLGLADEMYVDSFGEASGEEERMREGEMVGTINFQPYGWDQLSAMVTMGDMAKEKLNPDSVDSLNQPSSPSSYGFSIETALSSVSSYEKPNAITGRLDGCDQIKLAGSTVSSSARTEGSEARESLAQTEDWRSGPSEDGRKYLSFVMFLLGVVIVLGSQLHNQQMWFGANGVSRSTIARARDNSIGSIPWVECASYKLVTWLNPHRVALG